jgi:hypothetical protein
MTPYFSLSRSRADNTILSIVAVTGLAGHAFGSWKSRTQDQMWLRDFLPEDLRGTNIRVLTFGYDSTLKDSTSTSSIQEFSRQLLDSVHSVRADTDKVRMKGFIRTRANINRRDTVQ